MKSLTELYACLLKDASRWCSACTLRDLQTITERVEGEGISFVTITLPRFCQEFERALDHRGIESTGFLGFKKSGFLPLFLQGLTTRIFDQQSGRLLNEPDLNAIYFVRQICLYAKKIELECAPKRTKAAFKQFVLCEDEVRKCNANLTPKDLAEFERIARLVFGVPLSQMDLKSPNGGGYS